MVKPSISKVGAEICLNILTFEYLDLPVWVISMSKEPSNHTARTGCVDTILSNFKLSDIQIKWNKGLIYVIRVNKKPEPMGQSVYKCDFFGT